MEARESVLSLTVKGVQGAIDTVCLVPKGENTTRNQGTFMTGYENEGPCLEGVHIVFIVAMSTDKLAEPDLE